MEIKQIVNKNRKRYIDLLFIADEQISMIKKYLYRGSMFALYDKNIKSLCIVTEEKQNIYEIKNFVTVPKYQRKGYGKNLISFVVDYYKKIGTELYVGTGDFSEAFYFYKECGFEKSHIVKNFFIDNYDHPIYENGHQLIDMIYLKKTLSSNR